MAARSVSLSFVALLPLRRQHHDHLPPFELGHVLDHRDIGQLVANPLEQTHADILVGDLAAPVAQRDLALIAVFLDEATQVPHLDRVIALVGARAELDFLDFDDLLLRLGLGRTLLFLVLELAVVHQPADRRIGLSDDLDEIDVLLAGEPQGFGDRDDAQRFVLRSVEPDFRGQDFPVQPVLALGVGCAAVEKSSDVKSLSTSPEAGGTHKQTKRAPGRNRFRPGSHSFWAISAASFREKSSTDITPRSWLPRARTATVLFAFSLSPTTRMYGTFCNECSRVLDVIFSFRKSHAILSPCFCNELTTSRA